MPFDRSYPLKLTLALTTPSSHILIKESKKLLHTQQQSTTMTNFLFVYLLLTLVACQGESALMCNRADNAAQRDQEALMEERHLQVEESMSVSAVSFMSLELGGVIDFADTEVAVKEAPIETPSETNQDTSTAATMATAKATKAAKSSNQKR